MIWQHSCIIDLRFDIFWWVSQFLVILFIFSNLLFITIFQLDLFTLSIVYRSNSSSFIDLTRNWIKIILIRIFIQKPNSISLLLYYSWNHIFEPKLWSLLQNQIQILCRALFMNQLFEPNTCSVVPQSFLISFNSFFLDRISFIGTLIGFSIYRFNSHDTYKSCFSSESLISIIYIYHQFVNTWLIHCAYRLHYSYRHECSIWFINVCLILDFFSSIIKLWFSKIIS